jgi:transcriptional regulator with GAF, ATPase, and Fis domain
MADLTDKQIDKALSMAGYRIAAAAEALGVKPATLHHRLDQRAKRQQKRQRQQDQGPTYQGRLVR